MKIQHKYEFDQNLTKITEIGAGRSTLRYSEHFDALSPCFLWDRVFEGSPGPILR